MTIPHRLTLDYQLNAGWLEPFVRGLQQGIAVAGRCSGCKKISFPPVRACECQQIIGDWVNLPGSARLVHRCDGTEGSFALVQFDGADTQTVVRLDDMTDTDLIGYLQACEQDVPALVVSPRQHGESDE